MEKQERTCPMCGKVIRKKNKKYCCEIHGRRYRYLKKVGEITDGK